MPTKGVLLGMHFDSPLVRALLSPIQFIWILVIANVFFSLAYYFGFISYKNFLVIAVISMVANIVALLIFNFFFAKEAWDWPLVVGLVLVAIGSITVLAHKEILEMF